MENGMTPVSYLALGDSLTEGIGAVSPNQHFVAQYFNHLKQSELCQMRNFGVSGMTSSELLNLITNPAVTRLLPRLTHISITTGGCDFIEMYENGPLTLRRLVKTVKKVHSQVKQILSWLRQHSPDATMQLLGFYIPLPAYELGVNKASYLVQWMNQTYAHLCQKYHAQLVNPFDTFFNRFDYFCDEVHPNQQGYDQLARLFVESSGQSAQHSAEQKILT